MTKKELFELVNGGPSAVARIFGIRPQAVSQWPDPIPEDRYFELKGRRPDLFAAEAGETGATGNAPGAVQMAEAA
jgi:hypothetical protein